MGSARDRFDRRGREKVQCRECALWFHNLQAHIVKVHTDLTSSKNPTDDDVIEAYRAKHGANAPLASDTALGRRGTEVTTESEEGFFKLGVARLQMREDLTKEEDVFVPVHDEAWVLGSDEAEMLEALALGMEDDDNVLIVGPPGIGKSSLAKELASACNAPLRRMSFRGDMRTSDLVGKQTLVVDKKSGQTITKYEGGVLPDAAERGHWMLIDEIDAGPAEVMFILHPVLERDRSLMLTGKDGGVNVKFNDKFRFIATANTLGYGDETGLYAGTGPMNEALLDRFGIVINMGYPTRENEIERLTKRTKITKSDADKMVEIASRVREAQRNDTTMTSLSPRRLIAWAEKTVRLGDARRAAKLTITNKLPADDRVFVEGVIQRYFGGAA